MRAEIQAHHQLIKQGVFYDDDSQASPGRSTYWYRFSGGLDTSAALLWMRQKGAVPMHILQTWASQTKRIMMRSLACHGIRRGERTSDRLPQTTGAEGIAAIQCGAFHNTTGGLTISTRRRWAAP